LAVWGCGGVLEVDIPAIICAADKDIGWGALDEDMRGELLAVESWAVEEGVPVGLVVLPEGREVEAVGVVEDEDLPLPEEGTGACGVF
jgi:hypothetical protein